MTKNKIMKQKYYYLFLVLLLLALFLTIVFVQQKETNWLNQVIEKEKNEPVANPPASLTKCVYKNKIVYYLPPRCCDIPSVLYNENGEVICAPDGGFTGDGDGKCQDFFEEKKDCEIIWEDSRS